MCEVPLYSIRSHTIPDHAACARVPDVYRGTSLKRGIPVNKPGCDSGSHGQMDGPASSACWPSPWATTPGSVVRLFSS